MNVLAIGDITGNGGVNFLAKRLRDLKRQVDAHFVVVNGENAAGRGLFPSDADAIFNAGADVITLGNHAFSKREIMKYLDDVPNIVRPANFASASAGRGDCVVSTGFGEVRVIALIGRAGGMDYNADNPFFTVNRLLERSVAGLTSNGQVKFTLVDFHAEATSEKLAMGYHLDGKISALWGTHTHVQTNDAMVLPGGTGYISDLGMSGPAVSVIGMDIQQSVSMFLGIPKDKYREAAGKCKIEGAVFHLNPDTALCVAVEAVRIAE
jgi:metallophosphoesterase (TIGR00282 family)